ncbi:PDZ and LIM domain protein Zasp isoform X2 [Glossina fuscipes]|uniref:PDZ and LIM domain protein Zasp isoform X2 n=1 Tax=Glossina fuscipes TaxID=7396 RepID=A0A9C5ZEH1_9MUSC|nr:PDZ and LIM domain protein Zasp isoform X2 [Glossina fuscipes]
MSQPQLLQIKLSRFDAQPWGFRLQGGVDFASPLLVQKVNGGSLAEQAGLMPGDSVVKINDVDVFNLRHKEAQDVVVRSGNNFVMTVQRGGSTWRPQITPTGQLPQPNSPYLQTVTKTSLAHKQLESQHVGCGYNNAAKPFTQGVDGSVKSIVNKQYNSPVGIYSDESIAETLSAQAEVLAGGVLGVNFKKNEKEYHAEKSEVLKLLREEESGKSTPVTCVETAASSTSNFYWTHSHAIGGNERRYTSVSQKQHDERTGTKLQHQTLAPAATHRPNLSATMATQTGNKFKPIDEHQSGGSEAAITTDNDFATASASQPDPRLIVMPVCPALQTPEYKAELEAAAAAAAQDGSPRPLSAGGHPACQMCGVGIVGVFVRIKDKNLHVECFKCATCGTSLKNQGYYNFNNKLYCDIHAKLAALQNPPAGTEGYVPVPIKPNTKLSASTISSALSAHGYNGVANGNSGTPTPSSVVAPNASTSIIVSSSQVDKVRDSVNSNCNSNCTTVTNATNEMFPTMATMPSNITSADNGDKPFEYVTLTGNVIRSVVPPGKGSNVNYKVSQGYVRPFGAIPATTTPRSSVIYPPQPQQWSASAPPPTQSKPISNPYATLPRSNVGQQEPSEQSLHPQHAETYFEDDYEVEQANKQSRGPLVWPPPEDENRRTPTATPLYIAPPGTQHIAVKPLEEKPVEKLELSITTGKHLSSCSENQESTKCHWQSRSAPQLTNAVQHTECESGSDSYTSTSTTTTTTSEEYQRMYAAQVHAYQMQQLYEQSGSDFDYHMDMEVAAMQQRQQEHHEHFNLTSAEYLSGRRSTQECAETLAPSLNTFKLVDMVREVTPSPVPQSNNQASRHVAFVDKPEVKEVDLIPEQLSEGKEDNESNSDEQLPELQKDNDTEETVNEQDCLIKEDRSQILESQRIFQPTPEIKIDIAPVRQIPPTKIPNPVPKQWINPMVAVLTTAPEVPFHMMDCLPPPTPCDECCCQAGSDPEVVKEIPDRPPNDNAPEPFERPPSAEPEETVIFRENPPQGSWLTKAITTAPEFPLKFVPPSSQGIPLPEETEAYMPPPIDMKPYLREDYRPKSPFVSALTVAPERPFEGHFDRDVPIHLLDLPTPKERLTLTDALATAPERPYTPLNPENATHMFEEKQKEQEKKKLQFQILDREEELGLRKETAMEFYTTERKQSKAFAAMQAFQCSREPLSSTDPPKHSLSYAKDETNLEFQKYCSAHERYHKRRDYFTKKEQELQEQLKQQQQQQQQTNIRTTQQTNKRDESTLYSSAKQSSSTNSSSAVQQMSIRSHASSNLTQEQKSSYSSTYESATAKTVSSKIDTQEIIQETAEDLEHSEVIFPPPSPLSHMKQKATLSGLHRPETLPKYQRNWTVLPTQSPVRTPEPSELRENVPLAFVDTPKTPRVADGVESNAVHKPVAKLCAQTSASSTVAQSSITSASTVSNYQQRVSEQRQQQSATLANSNACTQHTVPTTVPIIIEDRSGPVTMAFQSIDEHMIRDESQTPSRPYTPSSFTNKPAPIIPPYQTPEKLCFDECAPTHGKLYDRCSVSPLPDRARSPAPGPPPNPLAAIRAPRLKDDEMASVSQRMLQAGSITTGQSYLGAQQAKQQGQLLAHTETSSQSAMQSYMEKPEKHDQLKVGNVVVQKTEKESRLEEQKQSQLESHTKTQMGNVQIERRRKVTEEFEHTSSAKTTEIRTGSQNASSERRQSYGKTGYVANQAKRLSGLEEEISNLSSQSQAISARAANLTETKFPEVHGEGGAALFPSKPMVPSYSESKTASYVVSGAPDIKMVSSFAGKTMQPQEHLSNVHEASVVSAKQQQQKSLSAYSSNISSSVASCSQQQQQRQANAVSCSLTKASATNQAYATSIATNQYTSTTSQNVCPTMGALCGSRDTCCKSQQPVQTPSVNNYNNNYRPNASAGLTDFEPPQTRATSFAAPQSVMQTPLTAPAPTTTAVPTSTNYNIGSNVADGSSGGMASKGGAYGATSAPKRGRGIINKAVGPGVRVPLCNSCNTQIRGPFITALGRIWCPEHFICVNANCRRALQDIGFVEEKGDLYCEYCFEKYLAPTCSKCGNKIKGDCLNAIGKHFHPECFNCAHCGKLFGNTPFFLEDGNPYCEADWNELFTTKCFACGFPVEAGDRWVEALNHNYHSQCFNCTYCKQNLEGQSFYNKGGRPFCKNHAR